MMLSLTQPSFFCAISVATPLQWGAAGTEIKVPSGENTELKARGGTKFLFFSFQSISEDFTLSMRENVKGKPFHSFFFNFEVKMLTMDGIKLQKYWKKRKNMKINLVNTTDKPEISNLFCFTLWMHISTIREHFPFLIQEEEKNCHINFFVMRLVKRQCTCIQHSTQPRKWLPKNSL